jgi:ribosomal protein L40E
MVACQACGAENPDGAKFCYRCGTNLDGENPRSNKQEPIKSSDAASQQASENKKHNDTICPFCQAPNCQPMQKNSTEIEHKNYRWGQGCCGMFLLGPFGLLCGLCGTGSKIKSESVLWWTCLTCGKQHIALSDAKKKWEILINGLPVTGISTGIAAIIMKAILRWLFGYGFLASAVVFIVPIIFSIYILYVGISEAEKELSQELGVPITTFLSVKEKNDRLMKMLVAIGLALFVALFGLPLLDLVLGD